MAIKGKKKSQSRGSQARRRPAAMPRPQAPVRKPKWYQTTAGLSIAAIGGILVLIVAAWIFATIRSNAREADAQRASVDGYTGSVKAALQVITPAATDMSAAASGEPEVIAADAKSWIESLQQAQVQLSGAAPPSEAETAHQVFIQSVAGYLSAAQTFELAGDLPGEAARKLVTTTIAQVSAATALWDTAVNELERVRAEVGLGGSDLRSPVNAAPPAQPSPAATVPLDAGGGDGDGGGGNKDGGGSGGGKNQKDGGGND